MEKPELPEEVEWPEATFTWFNAWRCSARTDSWDAVQWQYMFDTALVHAQVWGSGDTSALGELRQRLAYLGLTFETKKAVAVSTADSEKVTPLDEIRKRREKRATPARRTGTQA